MRLIYLGVVGLGIVAACGSDAATSGDNPNSGATNSGDGGPGSIVSDSGAIDSGAKVPGDSGPVVDDCTLGESTCTDHATTHTCNSAASGTRWQDTPCASGSGCVSGKCVVAACSDECNLGDTSGAKSCVPYDIQTNTYPTIAPTTSTSDRARAYNMWLRRDGMAAGSVGDVAYSDAPTYHTISSITDLGDSSIWTGTYLAAEAMRLEATGSADARTNVKNLVAASHLMMTVTGTPGLLARYARKSSTTLPFTTPDLDCTNDEVQCNVAYNGGTYDYVGHVSRDQYQGIMMGYAIAYEALGDIDEDTRAIIRGDVVALVKELMKDRSVPVALTYKGIALPVKTVTMRFAVMDPALLTASGAVTVILDPTDGHSAELDGVQEFTPDLGDIAKQIVSIAPSIPRPSSAIMLASFFRDALLVTDGIAASKTDHDAILSYYTTHSGTGGNITDWLNIIKQWSYTDDCGDSYFSNNITMEPMYNLARLEDDPGRQVIIQQQVLNALLWPAYVNTKNSFFSFIYASNYASAAASVPTSAATQLAQFPAPPRIVHAVNDTANPAYASLDSACPGEVAHTTSVDVGDRVVGDFLWQREPWTLTGGADVSQTYPGVDYLVAYWMGRHHGFITDDTPNECLVWK
jgi:hypothetical protein